MAHILLVDDDPHARNLLKIHLSGEGHRISEAPDGETGLALVMKTLPDVVVLDVMLPNMDGWAVCQRIKSDPKTASIPVIILTARDFLDSHRDEKVLVHCRSGGRAAALVLLHAARTNGWTAAEAIEKGRGLGLDVKGGLQIMVEQYLSANPTR